MFGWLSDAVLLPSLVASTPPPLPPLPVPSSDDRPVSSPALPSPPKDMATLLKLYLTLGLFGAHRLYTCEPYIALLYLATFGLLGLGWLSDAFQLAYLLDRAEHPWAYEKYSLFTAYQLLLPPFGLLGLHQFYVGRGDRGWWYAATGGLLGLGVLRDVFTLPLQVREANEGHSHQQLQVPDSPPFSPVARPPDSPRRSLTASYRGARAALSAAVYGSPRCVACMLAPINTVFLDCGHSVFCLDCARQFVDFQRSSEGATREGAAAVHPARGGDSSGSGGSGGSVGGSAGPGSSPTFIPLLPCPICRRGAREIKQIRWG